MKEEKVPFPLPFSYEKEIQIKDQTAECGPRRLYRTNH